MHAGTVLGRVRQAERGVVFGGTAARVYRLSAPPTYGSLTRPQG
ncbi:hypothetical protein [Sphaerimonospora mesophila]